MPHDIWKNRAPGGLKFGELPGRGRLAARSASIAADYFLVGDSLLPTVVNSERLTHMFKVA